MSRAWNKWLFAALVLLVLSSFSYLSGLGSVSVPTVGVSSLPKVTSIGAKRKGLVVASVKETNMTWLADVPADWEIYQYVADDPNAKYKVPRNQGRESMVYLTYIIDHWSRLPDYMVFIHGHEKAWHQPEPLPYLLQALNTDVVDELGWVSLRCTLQNTCEGPEKRMKTDITNWFTSILRGLHATVYKPDDPWYEPLPAELAAPCCSQFAVSRAQVQKKPREFWERLRSPLLRDLLPTFESWNDGQDENIFQWRIGGVFEVTWHWFLGMPGVTCYDRLYCRNTIFQNKIHCDGTTWDYYSIATYENITCTLDP